MAGNKSQWAYDPSSAGGLWSASQITPNSNVYQSGSANRYTVDSLKYDWDGNITRLRRQAI